MAPKRKSLNGKSAKIKTTRKATTRYVVTGKFTLVTNPITKKEADKWAAKIKRQGGNATMKKA